ncbi:unnamed protein product [Danaus chrysippus]|uniref:(African queen) hypothetical protein n=1 Tax=Danaus chrysippus TaxID=151541 RepID=A0A8J2QC82_9NEOP|nr:unnamed protein product [Danaus chrysippus]
MSGVDTLTFRKIIIHAFCLIILSMFILPMTYCVKKQFFSLEHPKVSICDPEYLKDFVLKSWRKSRTNPIHYVDMNVTIIKTIATKFRMTLSFYQLLSNVYKPSFVEVDMPFCEILKKDVLVAPAFVEAFRRNPKETRPIPELECPLLPGVYSFTNMIMPLENIPTTFPFKTGRLYGNLTLNKVIIGSAYIDFQLKTVDV